MKIKSFRKHGNKGEYKGENAPTPENQRCSIVKSFQNARKQPAIITITGCFLAGALGLEPRAYGFGGLTAGFIFLRAATAFFVFSDLTQILTQLLKSGYIQI